MLDKSVNLCRGLQRKREDKVSGKHSDIQQRFHRLRGLHPQIKVFPGRIPQGRPDEGTCLDY